MSSAILQKWTDLALAVKEVRTNFQVPMHVLMGEAVDAARFVRNYWEPVRNQPGKLDRPGLSMAGSKLAATIADELIELQTALQSAHVAYLLAVAPGGEGSRPRAEFLVGEISSTLEWHFDDGVEDEKDRQLAALKTEHAAQPDSIDALAAELSDYAELGRRYAQEISGLGGFDLALLDEAVQVAAKLRELPGTPVAPEAEREALELRNRIAGLLSDRLSLVRNAARFIFRAHPDIARQVTSAYQRRRRAAARRAAEADADTGTDADTDAHTDTEPATPVLGQATQAGSKAMSGV